MTKRSTKDALSSSAAQMASVRAALRADVPCLLWGPPGTGKTAALSALANASGAHLETLIGSTLDPADVGGLPIPHEGRLSISPPGWAMRLKRALERRQHAWLLLDELSCSPPSVQAALLRVVNERQVAEVDLRGCRVLAAANPSDSAVDGGWLGPATANRWMHLDWMIDSSEWCTGEMSSWGAKRSAEHRAAAALVVSWIRHRPALLLSMPKDAAGRERGWPSPRAWSAVARGLAAITAPTPRDAAQTVEGGLLINGIVGSGAGTEFIGWTTTLDLPDPEDVLMGKADIPIRGDLALACVDAMIALAISTERERQAWTRLVKVRRDLAIGGAAALRRAAPGCVPDEAIELGQSVLEVE